MKKLFLAICLFMLVGCAKDTTPKVNVCKQGEEEITLVSVGDEIQTMTQTDAYTFQELSVSASFMEKEDHQQQILNNYKALYTNVTKGLDITMNIENETVIFTISLDFTTADYTELKNAGILMDDDIKYVSLDDTIKAMNLTCTIKE